MDVRKQLEDLGCILKGHFVGVSGKHLSGYCNIDPLLPHVKIVDEIIKNLVMNFKDDDVEVVAAPAVGAIPFSHWGAHHLMAKNRGEVFGVWADKIKSTEKRAFAFEREGFSEAVNGRNVLILEDMINQMTSIKAMIKTVREAGGNIIGVGSVAANKGASAEALDVPKFLNLCDVHYDAWEPADCIKVGLCSKGEPIVEDVGHGDDYKAEHPDYTGGFMKLLS